MADNQWWRNPLRLVTIELPPSNLKALNVSETVNNVIDLGANVVVAFAVSYLGGRAYYQSSIAPHHPDLGSRDILKEIIKNCKTRAVKVLAYVNCTWADSDIAKDHPDWVQKKADSQMQHEFGDASMAMCINSPYENYILKVVSEIVSNYDVDGVFMDEPGFQSWCACNNCKEKFKRDLDLELPTRQNWTDPDWLKFVDWRYKCIADFAENIARTVKQDDPKKICFLQFHFPISYFLSRKMPVFMYDMLKVGWRHGPEYAGWYIPAIYGENLSQLSKSETVMSLENYRSLTQLPVWWLGASVRYAQSIDESKPVFTLIESSFIPWNLMTLPETELKISIAQVVASGGQPWFAMYGPGVSNLTNWSAIGESYNQLKEVEEYFGDRESIKFAALHFSERSIELYGRNQADSRYLDHFYGFYKALSQSHIPFSIVQDETLANPELLEQYRVLILPNSTCLSKSETDAISDCVKKGRGLVATFRSSLFTENGQQLSNFGLSDALGVDYLGSISSSLFGYARTKLDHEITQPIGTDTIFPCTDESLNVKTKRNSKALCNLISPSTSSFTTLGNDSNLPLITVCEHDAGRAVYFAGKPDMIYLLYGLDVYRLLLEKAVKWSANADPSVTFANLPMTVETQAYYQRGKNRTIIHFINYTSETPRPINEVVPAHDVTCTLRIPSGARVRSIKQLISPADLKITESKGDRVRFLIPKISEYEIVCVTYQ